MDKKDEELIVALAAYKLAEDSTYTVGECKVTFQKIFKIA